MGEVIKAYKGFNEDMTCRDFQYEEGKEYEEERAEACNCGFHACEYPLDCLGYYDPAHSVYHEVEQSGEISKRSDDTKVASTKIKIGARVSIAGLVQAAIEYTRERELSQKRNLMRTAEHHQRQETTEHHQRQETAEHHQRQETTEHHQRQETAEHHQRQDTKESRQQKTKIA